MHAPDQMLKDVLLCDEISDFQMQVRVSVIQNFRLIRGGKFALPPRTIRVYIFCLRLVK